MISLRRIPLLLLAVLLTTGVVFSQTQITSGVIQGTVLDPSGAVIPGACVEAHNLDTQIRQATTSDESGRFSFLALTPGRYELIAKKEGFSTVVAQGVDLTVGQARSRRQRPSSAMPHTSELRLLLHAGTTWLAGLVSLHHPMSSVVVPL